MNEPDVFYLSFYVKSREIQKKMIAGVAYKFNRVALSSFSFTLTYYLLFGKGL